MKTDLAKRVTARADQDNLPSDHELRKAAVEFNAAVKTLNPKQTLSTWARLRRLWSEYSGELLV